MVSIARSMKSVLDTTGLYCPEPVLRTAKAMRKVRPGETLTVLATDPVAMIDFPYYCHHARLELVSASREADLFVFAIRKPTKPLPLSPDRPIG
jgi:tRNA 2-thiouridine synthesizing protein A